jgi:hypothetical protein
MATNRRHNPRTFRSGLEDKHSKQIEEAGLEVIYEKDRYFYQVPQRQSRYTPDFKLPKIGGFFYIESKGIWDVQSRQKHLLLKEQYGDELDVRFVFSNQKARLYKKSPTTYAAYCEKHGFQYAHKVIPQDWLQEALNASAA